MKKNHSMRRYCFIEDTALWKILTDTNTKTFMIDTDKRYKNFSKRHWQKIQKQGEETQTRVSRRNRRTVERRWVLEWSLDTPSSVVNKQRLYCLLNTVSLITNAPLLFSEATICITSQWHHKTLSSFYATLPHCHLELHTTLSYTPHHTTPNYPTPHHTTPHHTTPNYPTPHHITLHHITPHHTTPHHTTPHHTTPHLTSPHHTTPYHTTPHHTTLHHTISHHTTPHHTTPHHITPHHKKGVEKHTNYER